jgi:hypothetical protein
VFVLHTPVVYDFRALVVAKGGNDTIKKSRCPKKNTYHVDTVVSDQMDSKGGQIQGALQKRDMPHEISNNFFGEAMKCPGCDEEFCVSDHLDIPFCTSECCFCCNASRMMLACPSCRTVYCNQCIIPFLCLKPKPQNPI